MDQKEIEKRIKLGRSFVVKFGDEEGVDADYASDQELKKPQPPLTKAPMTDRILDLPTDFSGLAIDGDFLHVINSRKSHRVYTQEPMSLLELSYLLWCTQGVKAVRGKAYATLRTVPCGGARHEFECYLALRNVAGLEDGLYHYLPMKHQIEFLGPKEDLESFIYLGFSERSAMNYYMELPTDYPAYMEEETRAEWDAMHAAIQGIAQGAVIH